MTDQQNKLVIFQDQKIRRVWHNHEWFYSVVDIVAVLSESPYPRQYWEKVKQREFTDLQLSPIWLQLKLESADSKKYVTDCVNTKNAFRLVQSIPSKKAERFNRWQHKVSVVEPKSDFWSFEGALRSRVRLSDAKLREATFARGYLLMKASS